MEPSQGGRQPIHWLQILAAGLLLGVALSWSHEAGGTLSDASSWGECRTGTRPACP